MHDGQPRGCGPDGEVLAERLTAMAPTIIARWTREGRRFRSVGVAPRDEGDAGDSAKLDDDGPA